MPKSTVEFDLTTDVVPAEAEGDTIVHDLKYPSTIRFSLNNHVASDSQKTLELPFEEAVATIANTLGAERNQIIATMFEPISKKHISFDTSTEGEWVPTGTLGNQKVMYPRMGWKRKD